MDLSQYNNQQLKACLHALRDKTSGNKQELVLRLQSHDEQAVNTILKNLSESKANETNTNLLDASIAEENGEDPVAKLKGEVATLTQTVTMLVQQLQNVITGSRGNLGLPSVNTEQSHVAGPSPPAGEESFNVAAQTFAAVLPDRRSKEDVLASGVVIPDRHSEAVVVTFNAALPDRCRPINEEANSIRFRELKTGQLQCRRRW